MQTNWISQKNSSKLIIFFAGWGMNGTEVSHLDCDGFDVICFYDYRDLENFSKIEQNYQEIYVVAWSFGVACAEPIFRQLNLPQPTKAVAINGSLKPVDGEYGIPAEIFQGTLENYQLSTREKFLRRTCGSKANLQFFLDQAELRAADEQIEELEKLGQFFEKTINFSNLFTTVVVGSKDRIIPSQNQLNFWKTTDTKVVEVSGAAHYPFELWKSWQEIVEL